MHAFSRFEFGTSTHGKQYTTENNQSHTFVDSDTLRCKNKHKQLKETVAKVVVNWLLLPSYELFPLICRFHCIQLRTFETVFVNTTTVVVVRCCQCR